MSFALISGLIALALIDSTSIGTLGVPIFLLAARVAPRRILLFLATITAFYFVVGVAVMLGLGVLVETVLGDLADRLGTRGQGIALIAGGVAVFGIGAWLDRRHKHAPERSWVPASTSPRAYVLLALTAGLLELATMVPYLTAIGLLLAADVSPATRVITLLGYTLVMIVPALALLAGVRLLGRRVDPLLDRIGGWIRKNADSMLSWGFTIIGIILALNGLGMLF